MQKFGPQEFRDIDAVLDRCFGGSPEENRRPHLETALHARMRSTRRGNLSDYLAFLQENENEQAALATLITVGETYFFRTEQHFEALRDEVIPELIRKGRKRIRMLSAACASGEEPYSLAMVASMAHLASAVDIEAIDINPAALEKAESGTYSEWSLRSTTPAVRDRFFKKDGRLWELADPIRSAVHFQRGNLMTLALDQFKPGKDGARGFDVIFCRNALIYFKHDSIIQVIHRLCSLLRPGGYLFLGPTETLRGISRSFMLCHTHGTFYYRLHYCEDDPLEEQSKSMPDPVQGYIDATIYASQLPSAPGTEYLPPPEIVLDTALDTAWFDEIQRSADRIASLVPQAKTRSRKKLAREITMLDIISLVEKDDTIGALRLFEELPESVQAIPQSRLVKATLMLQTGHKEETIQLIRDILRKDELNAEAHYLMSLVLEESDSKQSRLHAETAAYLAPNFAMAQVRLGMLQARAKENALAQSTFKAAVEAFSTDDRRRLALFGGGFSAAGLRAVCEAELKGLEKRR